MKLRLPHRLQAALVAALASVSFTTLSSGTLSAAFFFGSQSFAEDSADNPAATIDIGDSNLDAQADIDKTEGKGEAKEPGSAPINPAGSNGIRGSSDDFDRQSTAEASTEASTEASIDTENVGTADQANYTGTSADLPSNDLGFTANSYAIGTETSSSDSVFQVTATPATAVPAEQQVQDVESTTSTTSSGTATTGAATGGYSATPVSGATGGGSGYSLFALAMPRAAVVTVPDAAGATAPAAESAKTDSGSADSTPADELGSTTTSLSVGGASLVRALYSAPAPAMLGAAGAASNQTLHVYILTGQSNSQGAVKGNPASTEQLATYTSDAIMWNGNFTNYSPVAQVTTTDWSHVEPQLPEYEGNRCMGPEYGFSYMMEKFADNGIISSVDRLGILKASLNGGGNGFWVKDTATYNAILNTAKTALSKAVENGYTNITIDGLLYLQGESNGGGTTNAGEMYKTFKQNLSDDLTAWLNQQGDSVKNAITINFVDNTVMGQPSKSPGDTDASQQAAAGTNTDGNHIGYLYTSDMTGSMRYSDNLHFGGSAQLVIGARYAYAFAVQNGKNVGAVRSSNKDQYLDNEMAWWMEELPETTDVVKWDLSSVSISGGNRIQSSLTVGGIKVEDPYNSNSADARTVYITGGSLSVGSSGIELEKGGLSIASAFNTTANQAWKIAADKALVIGSSSASVALGGSHAISIGEQASGAGAGSVKIYATSDAGHDFTLSNGASLAVNASSTIWNQADISVTDSGSFGTIANGAVSINSLTLGSGAEFDFGGRSCVQLSVGTLTLAGDALFRMNVNSSTTSDLLNLNTISGTGNIAFDLSQGAGTRAGHEYLLVSGWDSSKLTYSVSGAGDVGAPELTVKNGGLYVTFAGAAPLEDYTKEWVPATGEDYTMNSSTVVSSIYDAAKVDGHASFGDSSSRTVGNSSGSNTVYFFASNTNGNSGNVYAELQDTSATWVSAVGHNGSGGYRTMDGSYNVKVSGTESGPNVAYSGVFGAVNATVAGNVYVELDNAKATYNSSSTWKSVNGAFNAQVEGSLTLVVRDGSFTDDVQGGFANSAQNNRIQGGVYMQVDGGTFDKYVMGGSRGTGVINNGVHMVINGGTFKDFVFVGNNGGSETTAVVNGGGTLVINDGTFQKGIYAAGFKGTVNDGVTLTIRGGSFAGPIYVGSGSAYAHTNGLFTVNLEEIDNNNSFADYIGVLNGGSSAAGSSSITGNVLNLIAYTALEVKAQLGGFSEINVTADSSTTIKKTGNASSFGGAATLKVDSSSTLTLNADAAWDASAVTTLTVEEGGILQKIGANNLILGNISGAGTLALAEGNATVGTFVNATANVASGSTLTVNNPGTGKVGTLSGAGNVLLTGTIDGNTKFDCSEGQWTGSVTITGSNIGNTRQELHFNNFGTKGSTVVIDGIGHGVSNSQFLPNGEDSAIIPNIHLTGNGLTLTDGASNGTAYFKGDWSGDGSFSFTKAGVTQSFMFLGDFHAYSGNMSLSGAQNLNFGNGDIATASFVEGGGSATGTGTISGPSTGSNFSTVTVNYLNEATVGSKLSGKLNLVIDTQQKAILTRDNDYSGTTTVNNGSLTVTGDGQLGSGTVTLKNDAQKTINLALGENAIITAKGQDATITGHSVVNANSIQGASSSSIATISHANIAVADGKSLELANVKLVDTAITGQVDLTTGVTADNLTIYAASTFKLAGADMLRVEGALALQAGATLDLARLFATPVQNAPLRASGAPALFSAVGGDSSGMSINGNLDGGNLALLGAVTPTDGGTYVLATANDISLGGNVNLLNIAEGYTGTLSTQGDTGAKQLVLTLNEVRDLIWNTGSGAWDVNKTAHWHPAGDSTSVVFNQGDNVTFESGSSTATLGADITAGTMTLNSGANVTVNTSTNYSLVVSDLDSNGGSLTTSGSGTATFGGSDEGGVSLSILKISGGTVVFNEHVTVNSSDKRVEVTSGSVEFMNGLDYTGGNGHALVVYDGGHRAILHGTSDFHGKSIGIGKTGTLTIAKDATVTAGAVENSSTFDNNGALILEDGAVLTQSGVFKTTSLTLGKGAAVNMNGGVVTYEIRDISGAGDINITSQSGGRTYKLTGDLSQWTGTLTQTETSGNMNLNISGTDELNANIVNEASTNAKCNITVNLTHNMDVNGSINYTAAGPVIVNVGDANTAVAATFTNSVKTSSLGVANAGSTATFKDVLNLAGNATIAGTLVVDSNSATASSISGAISGGGNLVKNGSGTLNLTNTANSTRINKLTVSDGTVNLTGVNGSGHGMVKDTLTIQGGGTMNITANHDALGWGTNGLQNLVMEGSDGNVAKLNFAPSHATATVTAGFDLDMKGYSQITGRAFNTFDGSSIHASGKENSIEALQMRNAATVDIDANGELSIASLSQFSGSSGALTKTGAGTLILTGNTTNTATNVSAGTLALTSSVGSITGTLSIADGATLKLAGMDGTAVSATGTLTLNGNSILDLSGLTSISGEEESITLVKGGTITQDYLDAVTLHFDDSSLDSRGHLSVVNNNLVLTFTPVSNPLIWDHATDATWSTNSDKLNWHVEGVGDGSSAFTTDADVRFIAGKTNEVSLGEAITAGKMTLDSGVTVNLQANQKSLTVDGLSLGTGSTLEVNPGNKGIALNLGDVEVSGSASITSKSDGWNPHVTIESLVGAAGSVLNLKAAGQVDMAGVYEMNGGAGSDFHGDIVIRQENGTTAAQRVVAMNINSGAATQLADSVVTFSNVNNTNARVGLGVNTDATVKGLVSDSSVSSGKHVIFSGAATVDTKREFDNNITDGNTAHTLTINTAGGEYSTRAEVYAKVNLVKTGEGSQSFTADLSAMNGSVTASAGTLTLVNNGNKGNLNSVTVDGGTLELNNMGVTNAITLSSGTLDLMSATNTGSLSMTGGKLVMDDQNWLTSTGNLAFTGGTLDLSEMTVEAGHNYILATTTGTLSLDTAMDFTLSDPSLRSQYTLKKQGNSLVLTFAREGNDLIWDNAAENNSWTGSNNWHANGTTEPHIAFQDGDNVQFTSTPTNPRPALGADANAGTMVIDTGVKVTLNTGSNNLTVADLDSENGTLIVGGSGSASFGGSDAEVKLSELQITGGTVVFDEHVHVTGNNSIQPSGNSNVTFNEGISFDGQGGGYGYAMIIKAGSRATLGGTTNVPGKYIGPEANTTLTLAEDAQVTARGIRNSTTLDKNGNVVLEDRATLVTRDGGMYTPSLTLGADSSVTLGGTSLLGGVTGSGDITVEAGTVTMKGANTGFTGDVTVKGGTIELANSQALGAANTAEGARKITINADGAIDLKGYDNECYVYTLAGGTLKNTGNRTDTNHKQTAGLVLTEDSYVSGTGNFHVLNSGYDPSTVKLNGNTLTKTGSNTVGFYTTNFDAGTLEVHDGALDFNSGHLSTFTDDITIKLNDSAAGNENKLTGKVNVDKNLTLDTQESSKVSLSTALQNASSSLTADVAADKTLTVSGAVSGSGNLVKSGEGTLELTVANSYTGTTTVDGGTLVAGAQGALGSGLVTVNNDSTLQLTSSVSSINSLEVERGGTLTFAGYNGSAVSASALTLNSGSILDVSQLGLPTGSQNTITLVQGGCGSTVTSGVEVFFGDIAPEYTLSVQNNNLVLTYQPAAAALIWDNNTGNQRWSTYPSDTNWHLADANPGTSPFAQNDNVIFTAGDSTAALQESITAGTMTVQHDANVTVDTNLHDFEAAINLSGTGSVTFNTGEGTAPGTVAGTVTGTITGAGDIHKDGNGILVLDVTNNSTGAVVIDDGTVVVNNSAALGLDGYRDVEVNLGGNLVLDPTGSDYEIDTLSLDRGSTLTFSGVNELEIVKLNLHANAAVDLSNIVIDHYTAHDGEDEGYVLATVGTIVGSEKDVYDPVKPAPKARDLIQFISMDNLNLKDGFTLAPDALISMHYHDGKLYLEVNEATPGFYWKPSETTGVSTWDTKHDNWSMTSDLEGSDKFINQQTLEHDGIYAYSAYFLDAGPDRVQNIDVTNLEFYSKQTGGMKAGAQLHDFILANGVYNFTNTAGSMSQISISNDVNRLSNFVVRTGAEAHFHGVAVDGGTNTVAHICKGAIATMDDITSWSTYAINNEGTFEVDLNGEYGFVDGQLLHLDNSGIMSLTTTDLATASEGEWLSSFQVGEVMNRENATLVLSAPKLTRNSEYGDGTIHNEGTLELGDETETGRMITALPVIGTGTIQTVGTLMTIEQAGEVQQRSAVFGAGYTELSGGATIGDVTLKEGTKTGFAPYAETFMDYPTGVVDPMDYTLGAVRAEADSTMEVQKGATVVIDGFNADLISDSPIGKIVVGPYNSYDKEETMTTASLTVNGMTKADTVTVQDGGVLDAKGDLKANKLEVFSGSHVYLGDDANSTGELAAAGSGTAVVELNGATTEGSAPVLEAKKLSSADDTTLRVVNTETGPSGRRAQFNIGQATQEGGDYQGVLQYGVGADAASGSGMDLHIKDNNVAAGAVLEAYYDSQAPAGGSVNIIVDTGDAMVLGLSDNIDGPDASRAMKVSGAEGASNKNLYITGDDAYMYAGKLGSNLNIAYTGDGSQTFEGGVDNFHGSVTVNNNKPANDAILVLQNAASVSITDLTIGSNDKLQIEDGSNVGTAEVSGTLLAKGGSTMGSSGTASVLNGDLALGGTSTFDVSAAGGQGGLNLTGALTINTGAQLSANDLLGVKDLGWFEMYDLAFGVTNMSSFGQVDWSEGVDVTKVFANTGLKAEEYYVRYSGVGTAGGNGSNVGAVYIYHIPEPTTSTLSLLALAALAARRRRK